MLHQSDRWIQFHEIAIGQEPIEAPRFDLGEVLPHLERHIDAGDAYQIKEKGRSAYRITDYRYERRKGGKGALILLLQYADRDATDPAFADLETGGLRYEPKLDGEGVAVSAHAVIGLEPAENKPSTYPFLLEIVPGLGRSNVGPFLRRMIKDACQDVFQFESQESGAMINAAPASDLLGVPSQPFVDELEEGQLAGVELIQTREDKKQIDEEGCFYEDSYVLKIKVAHGAKRKMLGAEQLEMLRQHGKKEGFENMRVRYKKKEGRQKQVILGTSNQDLADALVVKDELISMDRPLHQCAPEIDSDFATQMVQLLEPTEN